jgi:hypothetical protein
MQFKEINLCFEMRILLQFEVDFMKRVWLVILVIAETPFPENVGLAICHSVFVKGDHTNFEIEPSFGVEASALYPDVNYTTVDESLDHFLWELQL